MSGKFKKGLVAVALSGGVDSSLVTHLMIEEGHEVIALTMDLFEGSRSPKQAAKVAKALRIKHEIIDLKDDFNELIVDPFIAAYASGLTPNPCVNCNKLIKMGKLLEAAKALGAQSLATGHYVRIKRGEESGRSLIQKGRDDSKDQSYMLWRLEQRQIERMLTPLGDLLKEEVRALATSLKLPFETEESQEICFVEGDDYVRFLKEKGGLPTESGEIVLSDGRVVGRHFGLFNFTIGQRRGLGVSNQRPLYVMELDSKKNRVIVGPNEDLFKSKLTAKEVNLIPFNSFAGKLKVEAKVRYNMRAKPAKIEMREDLKLTLVFDEPERAITPGQSVVFYQGDLLIGGGAIESAS